MADQYWEGHLTSDPHSPRKGKSLPITLVVRGGLLLALLAGIGALVAALGYRWELLPLGAAFGVLRWSAYFGLAAAALSLAGVVFAITRAREGWYLPVTGLVLGLLVVGLPYHQLRIARSVPPIHDITTDLDDPPRFVAVVPLRAGSPNSVEHGGPEVAAQQRRAYPDIVPIHLTLFLPEAFEQSLAVAQDLGWDIVQSDVAGGRIEATDETFWFGFKDDIVIRVREDAGGSRVDVRSLSRVGRSDVGANARRIRKFSQALRDATTR